MESRFETPTQLGVQSKFSQKVILFNYTVLFIVIIKTENKAIKHTHNYCDAQVKNPSCR